MNQNSKCQKPEVVGGCSIVHPLLQYCTFAARGLLIGLSTASYSDSPSGTSKKWMRSQTINQRGNTKDTDIQAFLIQHQNILCVLLSLVCLQQSFILEYVFEALRLFNRKGLPPERPHRRWGCWGLSISTAFWACWGGSAVTVAAFRYNMCAWLSKAYASCFMIHSFVTLDFFAYHYMYIITDV